MTRATSKGPIPNILGAFLVEVGALVIRHGDKWYVYTSKWHPAHGWSLKQFVRRFGCQPPHNLQNGWWGIVPGLCELGTCKDANWVEEELQAALDSFADEHSVHVPRRSHAISLAGKIYKAPPSVAKRVPVH